jgi:hypothetical protein
MIINWKKAGAGVLVIPCMNTNRKVVKHMRLIPGHNDVRKKDYEQAEEHLKRYIDAGTMEIIVEEVERKSAKPVKKGEERKSEKVLKKVKNISKIKKSAKVLKIVQDTWDVDTLESWRIDEGRDEIRAAISNQIELVNKEPERKEN